MANDSTTAGYLLPTDTPPLEDTALEDFFHDFVQGVTGFADATLVRPRWQPEPPNQPGFQTDWLAFGITSSVEDNDAFETHDPTAGAGIDTVMLTEELTLLLSFYGPNASQYAQTFRSGVKLSQNRDVLRSNGIGMISCGEAMTLPALTKETWVRRVDVSTLLRRNVTRTYQVRTITSAQGTVNNELYTTTVTVTGP